MRINFQEDISNYDAHDRQTQQINSNLNSGVKMIYEYIYIYIYIGRQIDKGYCEEKQIKTEKLMILLALPSS